MTAKDDVQFVDYECRDRIAVIALNRPDKLNAVSDEVVRQLMAAFRRFDGDPQVDVAVLCGRGRAFCSGADVHQRQLRSREEFERLGGPQGHGANAADLLFQSVHFKPVIAAVHGYVLGLGLGMMLDCDLIVAESGTRLQLTETSRGLGAAKHWAQFHFRGAGAFGDEVALTGRYFTAEEAHAANVINRLAPSGALMDTAMQLAREVAANPPLSVRATVRARRWYLDRYAKEAAFMQAPMRLYLTEDFQEAATAFKEKRKPRGFKGR
ncbi:enoyl-CoA hydratase/isomerase family protein [Rhodopila sp.]|uniref:enoyl-CoA hydratase/isomerase family protein n=1 Tax=Rhodopila sp. TaxID=2480087 RepID=UPI002BB42E1F|nr:enoyl-CoA hydratase/isomerase family protein [Rhodopila sp.]HVZ09501.1 enoyl-CoA hydratase/isomerase family protein [Rhodopila sp.]